MNRKIDFDQRRAVIERLAKAGLCFSLATITIFARAYRSRVGTIYADLRSFGLAISARRRADRRPGSATATQAVEHRHQYDNAHGSLPRRNGTLEQNPSSTAASRASVSGSLQNRAKCGAAGALRGSVLATLQGFSLMLIALS
jgi:hypothetical protein